MHLARLLAVVLVALLAAWSLPAQKAEKEPKAILKLFVDEFVELTPGKGKFPASFVMGSDGDKAAATEKPTVEVTFAAPFAIAKYEVTQELYRTVMDKEASRWRGPRNSSEMLDWDDAVTFCAKVTAQLRKEKLITDKEVIRLPSEAEWEYACRAGTKTAYSFGDKVADLRDYAWFNGNSKGEDPPVGKKKPNAWGLYDMHGYIWEWCADAWHDTHKDAPTDGKPRLNKDEKKRVLRGGSWADPADSARCAFRVGKSRDHKSDQIGFRCVKSKEVRK